MKMCPMLSMGFRADVKGSITQLHSERKKKKQTNLPDWGNGKYNFYKREQLM